VLLPQVATEWGWTRDELLAHACEKAALDPDAWRMPSTRIEVFTAEIFAEAAD
jgi:AMMECR1 domain-containing protein